MEKKSSPYYIASGILFSIFCLLRENYVLLILPIALIVIGIVMKTKE